MEARDLPQKKQLRENELKERGWIKQNTIGEPRLSEIAELYESLGYEVHIEPVVLSECMPSWLVGLNFSSQTKRESSSPRHG